MERLSHCTRSEGWYVSSFVGVLRGDSASTPPVTQAYASTTAVKQPGAAGRKDVGWMDELKR